MDRRAGRHRRHRPGHRAELTPPLLSSCPDSFRASTCIRRPAMWRTRSCMRPPSPPTRSSPGVARAVGISERVFADGNADRRVEPAEVDILAWRLRDANVDPVAICLLDACVDGGNEWNRCHAPCPVKTGRTGCKASIRPGFRRIGRVRTRIAARPHPPSFLLRCHPGLDPGSRATGIALARLTWTPDQVRGDNKGGGDWSRSSARCRARESKPDSSGTSPGMTEKCPEQTFFGIRP